MADKRQRRAAEFIEPFRVKPGSKVILAKDFDPAFKGGVKKKKEGVALLAEGVRLLSEYQARLAAQDTWGVLVVLQALDTAGQGRDDPPRDERGQPAGRSRAQLQGALGRGARPRFPLALCAASAAARRDRHLQPLPLRGGARGARASGESRPPEAAQGGEGAGTSGGAATARSTTGSATSPRTDCASSSCS